MFWLFAIIFSGLWALGMLTSNNLGMSVHVLLLIAAVLAGLGLREHRKLAWQHAHAPRPPQ